jgi:hypothetical protein
MQSSFTCLKSPLSPVLSLRAITIKGNTRVIHASKFERILKVLSASCLVVMCSSAVHSAENGPPKHLRMENMDLETFDFNPSPQIYPTDAPFFSALHSARETCLFQDFDAMYPIIYPPRRYNSPQLEVRIGCNRTISLGSDAPAQVHLRHLTRSSELETKVPRSDSSVNRGTDNEVKSEESVKQLQKSEKNQVMRNGIDSMMDRLLFIQRIHGLD